MVTVLALATLQANASSHREAPGIAGDPAADITDVYAFRVPGQKLVLIMNVQSLANPGGGPNFHQFDPDVIYRFHIDNEGDGVEDITFGFRFKTTYAFPGEFLYNLGDIANQANLNVRQTFDVARWDDGVVTSVIARDLAVAPNNVGVVSTPGTGYTPNLTTPGSITTAHTYTAAPYRVFAGPRAEAFYVDLERTFDLLNLAAPGNTNTLLGYNTNTIAIEVPLSGLTRDGQAPDSGRQNEVVAVWASTARKQNRTLNTDGTETSSGPLIQIARLGNPLVNEAVIGIGDKDKFNASNPINDAQFLSYVQFPTLPIYMELILGIPNPGAYDAGLGFGGREDLILAFLTGHPAVGNMPGGFSLGGPIPGEPGKVFAAFEALRINLTTATSWPNGRGVNDDVVDTALSALAGLLIDGTTISDGVGNAGINNLSVFPYLGDPWYGDAHPQNYHP